MSDCSICCEPFTKVLRKQVKCCVCDVVCCMVCAKRYLTESIVADARCMACNGNWGRQYLIDTFSHSWLNGNYKKHTVQVIGDREMARLQVSNDLALLEKDRRENVDNNVYYVEYNKFPENSEGYFRDYRRVFKTFPTMVKALHGEVVRQTRRVEAETLRAERRGIVVHTETPGLPQKSVKSMPCCRTNECRGFLNSDCHCDLCDVDVCKSCREICAPDHVCDSATLETMKLLKSDTKDCPKCSAGIFKIDGCDQMWCTQCHSAFSWRTGKMETSVVHNPHYFQYMRQQNAGGLPRQPGDVPCGRINITDNYRNIITFGTPELIIKYQQFSEFQQYVLSKARRENAIVTNYQEFHVKYILGDYTLDKFRSQVYGKEAQYMFKRDNLQIFETFAVVAKDAFSKVFENVNVHYVKSITDKCNTAIAEIENIRTYCVNELHQVGLQYNRKPVII